MPARHVIHTVGPVYGSGGADKAEKLAQCYRNSLGIAAEEGFATVAFPAISTGVYGYPDGRGGRGVFPGHRGRPPFPSLDPGKSGWCSSCHGTPRCSYAHQAFDADKA